MSAAVSFTGGNALQSAQSRQSVDQTAANARAARSTCVMSPETTIFGIVAHPRQKHLHLRNGRVLGLVQNDEGVVERPPAHVRQRNHLDHVRLLVAPDQIVLHHLAQCVHQRPKIGVDLGLKIAGQEAETLAGLDRRPNQHDFADLFLPKRGDGQRHGQIRLARARRTRAQHQIVAAHGLDVAGLTGRPGADVASAAPPRSGPPATTAGPW